MKKQILLLFVLCILAFLSSCGENQITLTDGKVFTIKYDHQISYDCLRYGTRNIDNAFNEANTSLEFMYNDTLTDSYISEADLGSYFFEHVERDSTGVNRKYPGYLCGIRALLDSISGDFLDTVAGESTLGQGYSFVCTEVADFLWYLDKHIIHELGHQRAALRHLCLTTDIMSPLHDDSACVMGQGETAICTGKDLTREPQFCPACLNTIKQVTW
jgi:hypothetical protein